MDKKEKSRISLSGRWQHRYLKNFVRNADGSWKYIGTHYLFKGTEEEEKKRRRFLLLLSAAAFAGGLGGGLVSAPGTLDTWYVVLPLALTFLMTGFVLYKSISLCFAAHRIRDYDYKSLIVTTAIQNMAALVFSAAAVIVEFVYVVLNGAGQNFAGTILFVGCETAAFVFSFFWRKKKNEMDYEEIKSENENVSFSD